MQSQHIREEAVLEDKHNRAQRRTDGEQIQDELLCTAIKRAERQGQQQVDDGKHGHDDKRAGVRKLLGSRG